MRILNDQTEGRIQDEIVNSILRRNYDSAIGSISERAFIGSEGRVAPSQGGRRGNTGHHTGKTGNGTFLLLRTVVSTTQGEIIFSRNSGVLPPATTQQFSWVFALQNRP